MKGQKVFTASQSCPNCHAKIVGMSTDSQAQAAVRLQHNLIQHVASECPGKSGK